MNLPITITQRRASSKINVAMDVDRFERLAASLGLFRKEFLSSLDRAEDDIRHGRVTKVKRLRDLSQ